MKMSNLYDISTCGGVPVSAEDRMRYLEEMHTRLVEYAAGMSDTNEYLGHRLRIAEERNEQLQWRLNETELCLQSQPKKVMELRFSEMRRLELEGVIAYLNDQLEVKDDQIEKLKMQLSAKDHELQALLDSSVQQVQGVIDTGRERADDALQRIRHYIETVLNASDQANVERDLDDRQSAMREVVERAEKWAAQALERSEELQKYTELFEAFETSQAHLNEALGELALVYAREQADNEDSEDDYGFAAKSAASPQAPLTACSPVAASDAISIISNNSTSSTPMDSSPNASEANRDNVHGASQACSSGSHASCYSGCAVQTDSRFDGCPPLTPAISTTVTQIGAARPRTVGPETLMSPPGSATTGAQQTFPYSPTGLGRNLASRPTAIPDDASVHREAVVQTAPQTIESCMEQTRRMLAAYTSGEQFTELARLPAPYRGPQQAPVAWQGSPPAGRAANEWPQVPVSRDYGASTLIPSSYSPRGVGSDPFEELPQPSNRSPFIA